MECFCKSEKNKITPVFNHHYHWFAAGLSPPYHATNRWNSATTTIFLGYFWNIYIYSQECQCQSNNIPKLSRNSVGIPMHLNIMSGKAIIGNSISRNEKSFRVPNAPLDNSCNHYFKVMYKVPLFEYLKIWWNEKSGILKWCWMEHIPFHSI